LGNKIFYYEEVDSTNTKAKEYAKAGGESGSVFVAECQTKGRGRQGRTWASPRVGNIYASILLRPQIAPENASMLTLVMGYAIALAIEKETKMRAQIKWPNDLVIKGKKICGILTEMNVQKNSIEYVIIGVGINVNMKQIAPEIQEIATSLQLESEQEIDTNKMLSGILQEFHQQYTIFLQTEDVSNIRKQYNERLVNIGREILIIAKGGEYQARTEGINDKGELIIEKQDGTRENISSGEVSVRGVYGYV